MDWGICEGFKHNLSLWGNDSAQPMSIGTVGSSASVGPMPGEVARALLLRVGAVRRRDDAQRQKIAMANQKLTVDE